MRVDFRCAHAGVAEHLLYGKEIGAAFEEVSGETMPKSVWTDGFVDAILLGEFFHDKENHLACEACASAVEEDGVGEFGFGRDVQSRAFYVLIEDFQATVANGDEAFLATFAKDAQKAVFLVDVADLQADELRNA